MNDVFEKRVRAAAVAGAADGGRLLVGGVVRAGGKVVAQRIERPRLIQTVLWRESNHQQLSRLLIRPVFGGCHEWHCRLLLLYLRRAG